MKNHRKFSLLLAVAFSQFALSNSWAEEIVSFQIDGFAGTVVGGSQPWDSPPYPLATTNLPGSTTTANLQTVALTVGTSFSPTPQANFYRFSGSGVPTTSVTSNNYIEFTLDPVSGYSFSLEETNSVQVYSRIYSTGALSFIATSLDNFVTQYPEKGTHADTKLRQYDLPGFDEITSAVTFRIYIWNSSGGGGGFSVRSGGNLGSQNGNLEMLILGSTAPAILYESPTGLAATATGETSIDLNWIDTNEGQSGYEIQRSPNGTDAWSSIVTVADGVSTYSDTGLSQSTAYYYRIRASGGAGFSPLSAVISAFTDGPPPAAASDFAVLAPQGVDVHLTWVDNSANESGFRVERSTDGVNFSTVATVDPNITFFRDRTVLPGTDYIYRIIAFNAGGDAAPTAEFPVTTPANSHVNYLMMGNSFSHFYEYLPGIAQSMGDSIHIAPLRGDPGDVWTTEMAIARGDITPPTYEEALLLNRIQARAVGWVPLETDYAERVRFLTVLNERDWDVISFQAGSPSANNDTNTKFTIFNPATEFLVNQGYEPSAQPYYYLTTQYGNDAMIFRNPHNPVALRDTTAPYTLDMQFLDALIIGLVNCEDTGFPMAPGGAAMQNLRYDPRWGINYPDVSFDYFNVENGKLVPTPDKRRLFYGMRWQSSPQGENGVLNWTFDSHPHSLVNFLTACMWYEILFHKDVRNSEYVPENLDADTCAIIRDVAHRTVKGELPPLRLADAEAREDYADILWDRAQELLVSDDPDVVDAGYQCLIHLVAYFPEHAQTAAAAGLLDGVDILEHTESLARIETAERPNREALFQKLWDSSHTGNPVTASLGPDVDVDGDGIPAGIEAAFGLSFFASQCDPVTILPEIVESENSKVLRFQRRRAILRNDLSVGVRTTSALGAENWAALPAGADHEIEVIEEDADGNGTVQLLQHNIRVDTQADASWFYQWVIE